MNKIITFALSFFTFLSLGDSLSVNSTYMNQYNDFIKQYKKDFSQERFLTFKENSKFIEDFSNNNTFNVSINEFSDLNFSNNKNHLIIRDNDECYNCFLNDDDDIDLPLKVDWRQKDAVTGVKNQGRCGGCWAFSATGSVEGVFAINTGELHNISEQQLIDCSAKEGNNGCHGGLMDQAFEYIIDNKGLCSEEEYPYVGMTDQCNITCKNVVKISNYSDVTTNNEFALKKAVSQQPVSVAIQANTQSFQHYSGGVYSDVNCGTKLDHGVLVVGYGTDHFKGMDYWIVKNSWGYSWGENGYIKILRNFNDSRGLCGIAMQPSFPIY
jgi:C1A family cysteine protease